MSLKKYQANIILLIVAFIWGFSYVLIKIATLSGFPSGLINSLRGIIFVCLIYCFFFKSIHKMTIKEFISGLVAGILYFGVVQSQSTGLKYTSPSNSAFLSALYVILVPFVAWLFFHRVPALKSYFSTLLCLIGMSFLTGIFEHGFHIQLGDALSIVTAVFFALQILWFEYSAKGTRPMVVAFILAVTQTILSVCYTTLFESQSYSQINWLRGIVPIILLGVVASFLAQTFQIISQRYTDSISAGIILMNESLFATILSVLFDIERLTWNLIIGGIIIILSLVISQFNFIWLFKTIIKSKKKLE